MFAIHTSMVFCFCSSSIKSLIKCAKRILVIHLHWILYKRNNTPTYRSIRFSIVTALNQNIPLLLLLLIQINTLAYSYSVNSLLYNLNKTANIMCRLSLMSFFLFSLHFSFTFLFNLTLCDTLFRSIYG